MPNTLTASRAALLALLRAVPAIGVVHACERYASSEQGFKQAYLYTHADPAADAFGADPHIRGWYVRRVSFRVVRNGGGLPRVFTTWQIRGFMALAEEAGSELAFDALVDAVRAAFDVDPTIGGAVMSTLSADGEVGAQLSASGPVMFAGVLCHAADMTLTTETIE